MSPEEIWDGTGLGRGRFAANRALLLGKRKLTCEEGTAGDFFLG